MRLSMACSRPDGGSPHTDMIPINNNFETDVYYLFIVYIIILFDDQ
jgi:hypothetical protein